MSAHKWRLMDTGPAEAGFNMALDEAIATLAMRNMASPSLRIYSWKCPSITIGRFQKASDIDLDFCTERDIPFVRRPTGGRAIFHAEELTYSFAAGTLRGQFKGDLFKSYSVLSDVFLRAFLSLGLDAKSSMRRSITTSNRSPMCFNSTSFGEITLSGRKIIGSAQRRWPRGMLQQGSIPIEMPPPEAEKVFFNKGEKPGNMSGLKAEDASISFNSLKEAIVLGFVETLGVTLVESAPSDEEIDLAKRLEEGKYRTSAWNLLR